MKSLSGAGCCQVQLDQPLIVHGNLTVQGSVTFEGPGTAFQQAGPRDGAALPDRFHQEMLIPCDLPKTTRLVPALVKVPQIHEELRTG